jgi:hypothetical protein
MQLPWMGGGGSTATHFGATSIVPWLDRIQHHSEYLLLLLGNPYASPQRASHCCGEQVMAIIPFLGED